MWQSLRNSVCCRGNSPQRRESTDGYLFSDALRSYRCTEEVSIYSVMNNLHINIHENWPDDLLLRLQLLLPSWLTVGVETDHHGFCTLVLTRVEKIGPQEPRHHQHHLLYVVPAIPAIPATLLCAAALVTLFISVMVHTVGFMYLTKENTNREISWNFSDQNRNKTKGKLVNSEGELTFCSQSCHTVNIVVGLIACQQWRSVQQSQGAMAAVLWMDVWLYFWQLNTYFLALKT